MNNHNKYCNNCWYINKAANICNRSLSHLVITAQVLAKCKLLESRDSVLLIKDEIYKLNRR